MKEYIWFETRLFIKDRKNLLLFLGVAIFLLGLLVYIPYQKIGNIYDKTQTELNLNRDAISSFPVHEVEESPEKFPVYSKVLNESQLLGQQEAALTFYDDIHQYTLIGVGLANERINAHELGYEDLSKEFAVPLSQSLREQQNYQYLLDHNIEIEKNAESGSTYLTLSITYFSSIFFFFILALSTDILIKDDKHRTIIQSYPIDSNQKIMSKLIIYCLATVIVLTSLFTLGYVSASFIFGAGSINYPRIIFTSSGYIAISTIQFLLKFFILTIFFLIHTILFSAVLNCFFSNQYLILFAGNSLYLISFLFSENIYLLRYTPVNFLNPINILNGTAAEKFSQSTNTFFQGLLILTIWSIGYGLFLSIYFSRKNRISKKRIEEARVE